MTSIDPLNVPFGQAKATLWQAIKIIVLWNNDKIIFHSKVIVIRTFASPAALILSAISIGLHAFWAKESQCSANFQRSGADVSLIAATLFAILTWYSPSDGLLDGGRVPKFRRDDPYFVLPLVAVIGTLIWGYGDLISLFGTKCGTSN